LVSVPVTHTPFLQQPFGHVVASHAGVIQPVHAPGHPPALQFQQYSDPPFWLQMPFWLMPHQLLLHAGTQALLDGQ
jgi:hypothetical protein